MIKKVNSSDLRIGMFLSNIEASWFKTPFITHTFKIVNKSQIEKIVKLKCKAIYIDTEKGLDVGEELEEKVPVIPVTTEKVVVIEEPPKPIDFLEDVEDEDDETDESGNRIIKDKISFSDEIKKAKEVRNDVENVVENVMADIKMGKAVKTEAVAGVAKNMVESIYRNKHAVTSLARLKDFNEYTFNHSVNVSILSATFGRHLGLSKKEVIILGIGGMLHDLGKMKVPESILNKPGSFTPEEFEIMKMHVNYTTSILEKSEGVPEGAKLLASEHHERCDGRGYPAGKKETEISLYGKIGAIVDVYDAITSDRVYHTARLPFDALSFLYTLSNNSLYKPYVENFIQCIGIYPIGSYIKLDTGEIAVVVKINNGELLRPHVRIMINSDGYKLQSYPLCNLAEQVNGKFKHRIIKSVHQTEYNLPASTDLNFLN